MTLRARLTLATMLLAAIGLAVAGLATHRLLHTYLHDRIDDQLDTQILAVARTPARSGPLPVSFGGYGEVRTPAGEVRSQVVSRGFVRPDLSGVTDTGYATVRAVDGSMRFRVLVRALPAGGAVVLALPLDGVQATLRRLLMTELVVASIVLGALALVAWWIVRNELRPLAAMGSTADAIAAGDLTQRVEPANDRTEVGRLGLALNTMLGRIETAFAARTASEDRLRRFVADASHELRTPLTSIRGYAELFRRGAHDRPEDLDKAMRRIEDEATRMGVLVDDLLLLARLDQGRPLERVPVDLVQVARDAVEDAQVAASDHTIVAVLPEGPRAGVTVLGDEGRLRQVLGNLLANATAHTPAGTTVAVRVHADGDGAVIEVADDGPGMSEDDAAHAFERFWRGDPSRARGAGGGSGLGLSIVAAIAAAHGGRASVETRPGAGATFRVHLA